MHRSTICPDVEVEPLLERGDNQVHDPEVEVIAAKEAVARGAPDLEDMVSQLQHGDVEGAAAEVIDRDPLTLVVRRAVGQRSGSGLVEHPLHIESCELSREHRALTLRLVEVRRHGDDGPLDHLAQMLLGNGLHVPQHKRLDLLDRQLLVAHHDLGGVIAAGHNLVAVARRCDLDLRRVEGTTNQPLGRVDGVDGIDREPVLR